MKNQIIITCLVLFGSLSLNAQTLLTCSGSKTGAKVSFVSKTGKDIKIRVDWKERSHFYPGNLVFTNATCTNCPGLGGQKGDYKIWTIQQTDASKPVTVAWAPPSTSRYCGSGSAVTLPLVSSPLPIGSSVVLRGNNTRLISILDNNIKSLAVCQNDISNAEVFKIVDAGGGKVALLATSSNKYVTHDGSQIGRIGATEDSIKDEGKFTIESLATGGFSIKASNGKYVQAAYSAAGVLFANYATPQKFTKEDQ